MRRFAIRIDDITPDMDWSRFERFMRLLDTYEICPLIGIIPASKDSKLSAEQSARNTAFAETEGYRQWLRERVARGWVPAVHGYYHLYTSDKGGIFPLNHKSEFVGIPYEEQLRMVAGGRESLRQMGVESDIFMAPSHGYDRTTLRVLAESGYKYVTDGYGDGPYESDGLTFLPISFLRKMELKKKDGAVTLVVHTWGMDEKEYAWFEKLFCEQRERIMNYRDFMALPAVKRSGIERGKEYWMAAGKRLVADIGKLRRKF